MIRNMYSQNCEQQIYKKNNHKIAICIYNKIIIAQKFSNLAPLNLAGCELCSLIGCDVKLVLTL